MLPAPFLLHGAALHVCVSIAIAAVDAAAAAAASACNLLLVL